MDVRDRSFLECAMRLAERGVGEVSPNPLVGAVLVKGGRILGRGFHRYFGGPHAEPEAIGDCRRRGGNPAGATLYVTLEPCDHFGKTPPCTSAIIESGIKKVVVGIPEPAALARGHGRERFRANGVAVSFLPQDDPLAERLRRQNAPYLKLVRTGLPYVIVKFATSLDGKIATRTGDSKWITGKVARGWAHRFRERVDAVLVGVETVVKDDPRLVPSETPGDEGAARPIRVVLDTRLRIPPTARVLDGSAPTLVATGPAVPRRKAAWLVAHGVEVWTAPMCGGRVSLRAVLRELARRGVGTVLIEGGGEVNASALESRLADRVMAFVAPRIIGGRDARTAVEGRGAATLERAWSLRDARVRPLGEDWLVEGDVGGG